MRKIITYISVLTVATATISCNQSEIVSTEAEDVASIISIYPTPPAGWYGGSNPYYIPAETWVGDVMPYYHNGTFHIFFLQDARTKGDPGFHPWSKFTTTNFVNYKYAGIMIPYGTIHDHDFALGTGSVVKIGDLYYAYYSGFNSHMPSRGKYRDVILLATSKDLSNWHKQKNFIIKPESTNGYNKLVFRDPYVFYNNEKNEYWMLVCGQRNGKATVMLYTSKNPSTGNWQFEGSIYTDPNYAAPECPQEFKWGNYWYLIFSENTSEHTTHYQISRDPDGPWRKPKIDVFDGQYMYAAKVEQGKEHTYLLGWVPTKTGATDYGSRMWGGDLVVHELKQNKDGTLRVVIPETVEGVFTESIPLKTILKPVNIKQIGSSFVFRDEENNNIVLFDQIKGKKMITATVSGIKQHSEFGFIFGKGKKVGDNKYYKININASTGITSGISVNNDGSKIDASVNFLLSPGKSYQLKLVIDGSVCVIYLNHKIALTLRIYSISNNFWGLYSSEGTVTFKNVELFQPS